MHASRFLVMIVALGALTLAVGTGDAIAQKKKATPPPAAAEQKTTPTQTVTGRSGNTLKDVLVKFKGELTTIGVLKQVEADYIVVEEEGVDIIYPVAAIRSIKILKTEEESGDEPSPKLEIKLQ